MCEQQRVQNLSREAPKCCAWQHQGGGPETRSGTVQSLKCCPCQQKRAARLPSAAPGSIKEGGGPNQVLRLAASREGGGPETRSGTVQSLKCCPCSRNEPRGSQVLRLAASRGGPRNALGDRPEPEVLPLPAETSREAPKCCAWQHQGGGPRNALGHRPEPEVLPLKRAARLPSAARQHQGRGGPETRSGTVQSLKCCPCQQKRAARLPSAAPGSIKGGGPRNALEHRPLPLPAETSREAPKCCAWQHQGGGPRNALGHRPEPEVLPLPAETSRVCQQKRAARLPSAAPGSIKGGGPRNALGHRPEPVLPLPAETSRGSQVLRLAASRGGGPRNALGHRPEPEVLPLPAETSREAPKCVSSVKRARAP